MTCTRCQLHETASSNAIPTVCLTLSGRPNALFFIGDRPGVDENRTGQSFTGPAGQLLRDTKHGYLSELDTHHWSVYATTVTRCFTPADTVPARCYTTCASYILDDIASILSAHIGRVALICLGSAAVQYTRRILGAPARTFQAAMEHQGEDHIHGDRTLSLWATYNPAHLLMDPSKLQAAQDHLCLLSDWMLDPTPDIIMPRISPPRFPTSEDRLGLPQH